MALRKKKTLLDQAQEYVEAVRPHVESAVSTTLEAVEEFVENTARPALSDAKVKAAPVIADARDRAAAGIADARDKAGPAVAAGAAAAGTKASRAKEAADARIATLRGEEPPKKGGKLRKLAMFAAVAGAVGFIAKKLQGGNQTDNWQSSYVPKPAPATASTPASTSAGTSAGTSGPESVEDTGGASPDEAIADASENPHPVTTPEDPADVVDIADADGAATKAAKK